MKLKKAMQVLIKELRKDTLEGHNYYYSWQSNLACVIMDNSDIESYHANIIARKFLDLLIKK